MWSLQHKAQHRLIYLLLSTYLEFVRRVQNSAVLDLAQRFSLCVQAESSSITLLLPFTSSVQGSSSKYLERAGLI